MRSYQRKWIQKRRADVIAQMGGRCARCPATEHLEVDHIDPSKKVSHRIWSWSPERRAEELAKCQLLCRWCHIDKTLVENGKHARGMSPHGSLTRYGNGCRCDVCHAGQKDYYRKLRARRARIAS